MSKHTPRPWTQMGSEIYGDDGTRIAEAVAMRDALLLMAAPDLLEALKDILSIDCHSALTVSEADEIHARARAAIAKATGEQA